MAQLDAPEQHQRLKLAASVLHQRHIVFDRAESQRARRYLSLEWQRSPVPGGAPKRGAIDPCPDQGQPFRGINDPFGKRRRPETRGGRHRPTGMGIAGPEDSLIVLRENEQALGEVKRAPGEQQQPVLQVESKIAGDLIVAGTTGMETLPHWTDLADQPILDNGVYVLMVGSDLQAAFVHRAQGHAQSGPEALMLGLRQEPRGLETVDMAEASQDVPRNQAAVPQTVLGGGVVEHLPVE